MFNSKLKSFSGELSSVTEISVVSNKNAVDQVMVLIIQTLQTYYTFESCATIMMLALPFPPGNYLLETSRGLRTFCPLPSCKGISGGWRRIAYLNASRESFHCPSGFEANVHVGLQSCKCSTYFPSCSSVYYSNQGREYSCIYGSINVGQKGSLDSYLNYGFAYRPFPPTIDDNYVDGISLTYGRSPRDHIWTFTAGFDVNLDCSSCNVRKPSFVGDAVSCEINDCMMDEVCLDHCGVVVQDNVKEMAHSSSNFLFLLLKM